MIDQYNSRQVVKGVIAVVLGAIAYVVTFVVLAFVFRLFVDVIGFEVVAQKFNKLAAMVGVVIVTIGGVLQVRSGQGHHGYEDSAMNVNIEPVTGGAFAVGLYANRVAVPGYILSQVFLAGPLQILKGVNCFKQRISDAPGLDAELLALQAEVEAKPKRHGLDSYPGREREVLLLARMGRIAFSPRKGTVFKKN